MKSTLTLTQAQARVLARLIRLHLEAYEEAVSPEILQRENEPLNGSDLDLLEPLLEYLK